MPFFNSIRAIGPSGSRRLLAKLKGFVDYFTQANNANSISQNVANWTTRRGTWGIATNKATSTSPASTYPITTFDAITKDVSIKAAGTGSGYGVSFWVTDENNWWGATANKTTYQASPYNCTSPGHTPNNSTGNCTYTYGASGGPSYNVGGGPYPVCGGGLYVFGYDCWGEPFWTKYGSASTQPAPYNYHPYNAPYNCPSGGAVSGSSCNVTYGGTASTWYQHDIRVLKSLNGTVSTVSTHNIGNIVTNNGVYVSFIEAVTGLSSVTVNAQLSNGQAQQSTTVQAGTPDRTSKFGMLIAPSTLSQVTQIDEFTYNPQ